MSNLGVYQGSAATTVGLNTSTTIQYQIAMLENSNELKELTFEQQATGVEDQNESTIALGDANAEQIRKQAWGTIVGATTSLVVESVASGSAMYGQSGIDELNNQINNVGSFKEGLLNNTPSEVLIQPPEQSFADELDNLASMSQDKPSFNKDAFLNGDKSLAEKGQLFSDNNIDYNKEAAAFADENNQTAIDTADRVDNNLQRQVEQKNGSIQRRLMMADGFSKTLNGLVTGSFNMASAETKIEEAQDQVMQNNAEFFTKNVEKQQQNLDAQTKAAEEAIMQTIQNKQAVDQASSKV